MTVESSEDVLDSILNWESPAMETDKEKADFGEAMKDFGQPLRFGQYINLLHVVSDKVVTRTNSTAAAEMQVSPKLCPNTTLFARRPLTEPSTARFIPPSAVP